MYKCTTQCSYVQIKVTNSTLVIYITPKNKLKTCFVHKLALWFGIMEK